MTNNPEQKQKRVKVEGSFDPATGNYRLEGVLRGEMPPRRRNFDSYGDMIEAVEKANPGREVG